MFGSYSDNSNSLWIQFGEFIETLMIGHTDDQVTRLVFVTNQGTINEYGLKALNGHSTEFQFDETYSLIGFMGSSSRYYINSLSAIRAVDCDTLAEENKKDVVEFSQSEEEGNSSLSRTVEDDSLNRLLFYIALIVLGIAVIALSAAFIACLI